MSHSDDVLELIELVHRLFAAADARDWIAYRALLVDEVQVNYVARIGTQEAADLTISADEFTAANQVAVDALEFTQHFITNHIVSVDGDTARVSYNEISFHRHTPLSDDPAVNSWTLYAQGWRLAARTSLGWRVSGTGLVSTHSIGNSELMTQAAALGARTAPVHA
jgi:hypothetical protein